MQTANQPKPPGVNYLSLFATNLHMIGDDYRQSRSFLSAEYASYVGPPETPGGPLALKDDFILVSFLNLASGSENMNDHLL